MINVPSWSWYLLIALVIIFFLGVPAAFFGGRNMGYNEGYVNARTECDTQLGIVNQNWQTKMTNEINTLNSGWQNKLNNEIGRLTREWQSRLTAAEKDAHDRGYAAGDVAGYNRGYSTGYNVGCSHCWNRCWPRCCNWCWYWCKAKCPTCDLGSIPLYSEGCCP